MDRMVIHCRLKEMVVPVSRNFPIPAWLNVIVAQEIVPPLRDPEMRLGERR